MRPIILALLLASIFTTIANGQTPLVTINGGVDETHKHYAWTVTNNYTKKIVSITFPHFGANLFFAPDGWKVDCTNLVAVGVSNPTGTCKATAESDRYSLSQSKSAEFSMQAGYQRAKRGTGSVTVNFEDGTQFIVRKVELPVAESTIDKNLPLIGLGTMFALYLLFTLLRRKKPANTPDI